jgi:hypothetical protein
MARSGPISAVPWLTPSDRSYPSARARRGHARRHRGSEGQGIKLPPGWDVGVTTRPAASQVALLGAAGGGTLETHVNERGTRCSLKSARSFVVSGPRSGAVRSEGATHCCRQTPHGQVRAPPATTTTGSATPPAAVAASARVIPAAASSPLRTSRPAPIGRGGRERGDLNPRPSRPQSESHLRIIPAA